MSPPTALKKLRKILEPAYGPCPGFEHPCRENPHPVHWDPEAGHIPRGFCGAEGQPKEVELVLVFAEPGNPQPDEVHSELVDFGFFGSALSYARKGFEEGPDPFYQNVRTILELCFPGESFDQKMGKVWMTESVLCSAEVEGGRIPAACWRECLRRYLASQLAIFPRAFVVALGGKAAERMCKGGLGPFMCAASPAPPGANLNGARESWQKIAIMLKNNKYTEKV